MKKKLLALLLVFTMVVGLITACSKKADLSCWDTLREMQKVTSGTFSFDIALKVDTTEQTSEVPAGVADALKDLHIKVDGVTQSSKGELTKASMSFKYKLPDSDKYEAITDVIYDGEAYYVNLKTIREFIKGLNDASISPYAEILKADNDYLKITQDDMKFLTQLSGTSVETPDLQVSGDNTKAVQILSNKVITILEKTSKNVKPEMVSEKDGTYTINVDNNNLESFLKSLKKVLESDGDTLYKEAVTEIKKLKNVEPSLVTELEDNQDKFVSSTTKGIDDFLKDFDKDAKGELGYKMNFSLDGKEGSRKSKVDYDFNLKNTETKENVGMSFKGSVDEGNKGEVTVPKESTSLTAFMTSLMSTLGVQ
ncbi:hypothetical protein [Anaeromicropila herbilytica]|uniref:Lipoprotein n=1 Tax=Anaeromicropila herbilytica TaxID=2785025 RepID=A0A7R7IEV9_9FIRM|nr:hypothetical protein [Anaeromicropila herbilytica]BCN32451.1 hypothetical protein bsdtb5_37460 [Anaeromicropila herbilytica]